MEKWKLQPGIACFLCFFTEKTKSQSTQSIQARKPVKQFSSLTNPALPASRVFFWREGIAFFFIFSHLQCHRRQPPEAPNHAAGLVDGIGF